MALKEKFMVKDNFDAATATLSLEAKAGESLLVKGLRFGALSGGGYAESLIDRLSVGLWYIGDINANHLEQWSLASAYPNVFERLVQLGHLNGYPIAEGETFTVGPKIAGSTVIGGIIYEVHDAGDITAEMPNGSKSKEYLFLNYGTNATQIEIDTIGPVDMSRNPSEYPAFPFGAVVPARHEIDLIGILLVDWRDNAGNINPNYAYLKLIKDREVLFDPDKNGIYVREGMGMLTWGPCRQTNVDLELFPEPLRFAAGDELTVQMEAGDTVIAAEDILMAAILKVRRVE